MIPQAEITTASKPQYYETHAIEPTPPNQNIVQDAQPGKPAAPETADGHRKPTHENAAINRKSVPQRKYETAAIAPNETASLERPKDRYETSTNEGRQGTSESRAVEKPPPPTYDIGSISGYLATDPSRESRGMETLPTSAYAVNSVGSYLGAMDISSESATSTYMTPELNLDPRGPSQSSISPSFLSESSTLPPSYHVTAPRASNAEDSDEDDGFLDDQIALERKAFFMSSIDSNIKAQNWKEAERFLLCSISEEKDPCVNASLQIRLAYNYYLDNKGERSLELLKAVNIKSIPKDSRVYAVYYLIIARVHYLLNDMESAKTQCLKSIKWYRANESVADITAQARALPIQFMVDLLQHSGDYTNESFYKSLLPRDWNDPGNSKDLDVSEIKTDGATILNSVLGAKYTQFLVENSLERKYDFLPHNLFLIFMVLETDNVSLVDELLKEKYLLVFLTQTNMRYKNKVYETYLFYCMTENKSPSIAKALINACPTLYGLSLKPTTPLAMAITSRNNEYVKLFIDNGVNIDKTEYDNRFCYLDLALSKKNFFAMRELLSKDAWTGNGYGNSNTFLHAFCFQVDVTGDTAGILDNLVVRFGLNPRTALGYTPLHQAILGENPETARWLIECGADMTAKCTSNGYSPRHLVDYRRKQKSKNKPALDKIAFMLDNALDKKIKDKKEEEEELKKKGDQLEEETKGLRQKLEMQQQDLLRIMSKGDSKSAGVEKKSGKNKGEGESKKGGLGSLFKW